MKAFAVAVICAVAIGIAASYVLSTSQRYAWQAFSTSSARVSHPGTNLVGPRWTGDVKGPHDEVAGETTAPKRS
ncbi:hypothetical protein [Methylobacterium oxalidis]|uniref:Uncharacterized protein n=1 Tax=Methylobacterium oxalidis TaxID=944322 RepID=A0A512J790_9HYPH|nr:hypothetical protein [Methylobacterium oxalidis]GEP05790.1 hypothetical protein MOX02_38280 [Methylobacterium oxalidis]GJE35330.1 hypothetical protein LDDCCGHA_5548 [Methylobacterium oxalidis]GLS62627.1 hypothetical protein GCM10007888_10080 [Methylobacterium oxalidis]